MNRRQFVALTVIGACGVAPGMAPAEKADATSLDAGPLTDYAEDGASDRFAKRHKVLLVRNADRLYAVSALCTHKRCTVQTPSRDAIICPCHGSRYDLNGVPIDGPAKVSLFRFGVSLNQHKHVIIDKKKQFTEKNWDDAAAWLAVE